MKQATFTTESGIKVLAVEVPENAEKIRITHNAMWRNVSYRLPGAKPLPFGWTHIRLPEGRWIPIGLLKYISEEQAKLLVKECTYCYGLNGQAKGFRAIYDVDNFEYFDCASEALYHQLRFLGMDTTKNILLLKDDESRT